MRITLGTSFKVANIKYNVRWMTDVEEQVDAECLGSSEASKSLIKIRRGESRNTTEHVWFHELVHTVLSALGREELNSDEGFVDGLAGLFHQAMKSKRGNLYDERETGI